MPKKVLITQDTLVSLASAIRSKTGLSSMMTPAEMVTNVQGIDTRSPITLTVIQNGEYVPPESKFYSIISVNVPQSTFIPDVNLLMDFKDAFF